jgi:hypothetical protein
MEHVILGELRPSPSGWLASIAMPAFQTCYERWGMDGRELRDTRDEERRQGRFSALLLYTDRRYFQRSDKRFVPGGKVDDLAPPSDPQIAAFEYLARNQAQVARELFTALAREAQGIFSSVVDDLPDEVQRLLSTVEGMMGAVEFEGPVLGLQVEDGCVQVGFPFHSDLLDTEHGVGVVMLRDRVVEIGQQDVLF